MMKKIVLLFLLLIPFSLFAEPEWISTSVSDEEDVIEIDISYTPPVTGPKRTPSLIPIDASYHSLLSFIEVVFLSDIGDVDIVITNLSSGTEINYNVSSSIGSANLPIVQTTGYYSITFTSSGGNMYVGYFLI